MKIFLVLSNAPDPTGEAIEVVGHEVMEKATSFGHDVVVQVILRDPRRSPIAERTERLLQHLTKRQIDVQPTLYVDDVLWGNTRHGRMRQLPRLINTFSVHRLFPASRLGSRVEQRVRQSGAEAIVSIWSWEALAATYHIQGIPKFVYYGNPDHLPLRARLRHPQLFGIPVASVHDRLKLLEEKVRNHRRKQLNVKMMNACEVTANNSALDVEFYKAHGHPNAIYLQNMWPPIKESHEPRSNPERRLPLKIIGSVGNLGATGNTFALNYLGRELMPRLIEQMKGRPFEVHLLGKGTPTAAVASALTDPRLKFRGWVEDIHEDFRSSVAFLVLTNVNPDFLVGNTRILLAWALGTCTIMHENSRLAMPEIADGVNCLLGRTPDELAARIMEVIDDPHLRSRIGRGGTATFESFYRSDIVVSKMLSLVQEMVDRYRASRVA